jgi:hypothetical protein
MVFPIDENFPLNLTAGSRGDESYSPFISSLSFRCVVMWLHVKTHKIIMNILLATTQMRMRKTEVLVGNRVQYLQRLWHCRSSEHDAVLTQGSI